MRIFSICCMDIEIANNNNNNKQQILSTGMVKVYFTYKHTETIGQAISRTSNFIYSPTNHQFLCPVNQYIAIISSKTGDVVRMLAKEGKNVPVRVVYYWEGRIYGGFEDGEIVVWNHNGEIQACFDMHKTTVSWICVDDTNTKLLSGSLDGSIIIWDLLSEQHHCIKSAHPSSITQLHSTTMLLQNQPTPIMLSIGKDGFLRVWNLNNYLCIAAITCQVTQAYCMYYDGTRNEVYVGTNKQDIVVLGLGDREQAGNQQGTGQGSRQGTEQGKGLARLQGWVKGVIKKRSFGRSMQIFVEHGLMYVINSDKTIEIYKMLSGKDLEARKKRLQSRKKKVQQGTENPQPEPESELEATLQLVQQKTVAFKFYTAQVYQKKIFLNTGSNIYCLSTEQQLTSGIGRTQQLCLQYPFLLQRSPTSVNVYSSNTMMKLFKIESKAEWCAVFSGGFAMIVDDHAVAIWSLTKNQEVFRLEEKWSGCWVKGNKAMLWRENQVGFFQVGYDKNKNIRMKQTQTRKFEDKVLQGSFKHKMDKYIICLQSSQMLINHSDTHKQFLKLYGHKLPITSFSLTSDDCILATGSSDKDIRLWDMDFGHSMKTLFAHQEPVTIVRWVHETHYLFSGGKDGHIKFWDMDTYQLIMDFQENTMEVRGLVVSLAGDLMVAGGLDDGFRVWRQTNDQTIASDMEDKQMEKLMIEDYAKQKLQQNQQKTRYQDLKHGQQIIQALQQKQSAKKLINLIKKIPAGNLKSCLSFLHQRHIRRLQQYIRLMIDGKYEEQTCWRVIRELNRGSQLGKDMREVWRPVEKTVRINTEILKSLLKGVQDQGQFL